MLAGFVSEKRGRPFDSERGSVINVIGRSCSATEKIAVLANTAIFSVALQLDRSMTLDKLLDNNRTLFIFISNFC